MTKQTNRVAVRCQSRREQWFTSTSYQRCSQAVRDCSRMRQFRQPAVLMGWDAKDLATGPRAHTGGACDVEGLVGGRYNIE